MVINGEYFKVVNIYDCCCVYREAIRIIDQKCIDIIDLRKVLVL